MLSPHPRIRYDAEHAIEREIIELKRRLPEVETLPAPTQGSFEFISGQLRDIQRHQHAQSAHLDQRLDKIETELTALPRVIAEMIRPA